MNGGCGVCLYLPLVRPPYHLSITFALFPIFLALIIMFFVNCKRLGLSFVVADVNPEYLGLSSVAVDVNPECLGLSSVVVDVNSECLGLSSVTADVNSEYLAVSSVSAPFPTGKGRGWAFYLSSFSYAFIALRVISSASASEQLSLPPLAFR